MKNTYNFFAVGFLIIFVFCLFSVLALSSPLSTFAGLVNYGTSGNPSGALSDSGCPSCNAGGLVGTNTGVGASSPISSTLPSSYGQSSYRSSSGGGGGGGYSQSSYSSSYSQGSYSTPDCGGGSLMSTCGEYSQGAYFSCPSGFNVFQGRSCCPSAHYSIIDTNGSKKGGKVEQCTDPSISGGTSNSCEVNGKTIANGATYTFYTAANVPYNEQCSTYAIERTCNNGVFSGGGAGAFSQCSVNEPPQISNITLSAVPPIIRYGESSTIVWDGANAEACTVTGYGLTNVSGVTGSQQVDNVVGESTYTLSCTLGPNTKSASTTLKILPRTQES